MFWALLGVEIAIGVLIIGGIVALFAGVGLVNFFIHLFTDPIGLLIDIFWFLVRVLSVVGSFVTGCGLLLAIVIALIHEGPESKWATFASVSLLTVGIPLIVTIVFTILRGHHESKISLAEQEADDARHRAVMSAGIVDGLEEFKQRIAEDQNTQRIVQ